MLIVLGTAALGQTPYDSLYLKNSQYQKLVPQFASLSTDSVDIVFLGNSITFGGKWNTLLGREHIVNMGIVSDNTIGMLHRLNLIYRLTPKLCFVMAGINDLYADAPVERVFLNYTMIIDTLISHQITPVIQSTLYVNPKWKRAAEKNRDVSELNMKLQQFAVANGIQFIDVNSILSLNGTLLDEYTSDGVHLVPAAYDHWKELLLPVLKKHGL
jgi:lysophospholipase L1-like esterase